MSPDSEKPTIEQLEKAIMSLLKQIQENEDKFRALLRHFDLYLDSEITMRSYKVKQNQSQNACQQPSGTAQGIARL